MNPVYEHLYRAFNSSEKLVLATIIFTEGSTPQIPGSSALFSKTELAMGTLGGGILEFQAQQIAENALTSVTSLLMDFNLDAEIAAHEEAVCGGYAKVLFDGSPEKHAHVFKKLNISIDKKESGILITFIKSIENKSVSIDRIWLDQKTLFSPEFKQNISLPLDIMKKVFTRGKPELIQDKKKEIIYLEPNFPQEELIIAGAGHIGQAVADLGHKLNFKVTVIDDRQEFANPSRLPEANNIIVGEIASTFRKFTITPDTYIVIVTRGHAHDAAALRECITSQAGYIGMIGSKNKIKLMREQFIQKNWATRAQFDRIFAPIGIDIFSQTIEEIAISIAAQLIEIRNRLRSENGDRK